RRLLARDHRPRRDDHPPDEPLPASVPGASGGADPPIAGSHGMILLLILVEVFAIGANFALPFMREASLHQRAVAIAQDMQRVRLASLEARNANTDWSAPPQPGALPSEVESRLPGLSFTHEDYRMVWDRWEITDPGAVGLAQHDFAAVTVITS